MRLVCFFLLGASAFAAPSAPSAQLLPKAPVRFEPNHGQRNRSVLWAARGPGYSIGFTRDATLLQLGSRTVSMRLPGQNLAAPFEAAAPLSAPTTYITPAYRGSVPAYGRLRRHRIYPGIDIVYYGSGDHLEYDFEIAPGADPSRIRMHFDGADHVRLSENGDLLLQTGGNVLTQHVPVVYQRQASGERVMVPAAYRIRANRDVTVALSHYDSAAPLVIDPVISFAGYLGGSGADAPVGIAIDSSGNVYLAGNTVSSDFPTANGVYTSNAGLQDVWLMKLNPAAPPDQTVVYSTYYGGTGTDVLAAMAIDSEGLVYIAGSTNSTDLPVTDRAFQAANAGASDVFVAWFDPAQNGRLSLLYASYIGGAAVDQAGGIAVLDRKIYVTGSTLSDNFPTVNANVPARNAARDIFVAEIDPQLSGSASLVASTYSGGSGSDYGRAIAVDRPGHAFVAGITYSRDLPLAPNAYQSTYGGGGDGFLAEFDFNSPPGGYSTYLGGSGTDDVRKIVIDPAGRIALTGYTSSADFAITQNAAQPLLGGTGAVNAFLTLLDTRAPASQAMVYSTYFGGSVAEVASDLKRDAAGKYYLGGYSFSPDLPVSQNTLNPIAGTGGLNGFVAVIDPSAVPLNALTYSSYVTGPGSQSVTGVDVNAGGAIYVTGSATGDIFPSGFQSHTVGHSADAFVLIFTP